MARSLRIYNLILSRFSTGVSRYENKHNRKEKRKAKKRKKDKKLFPVREFWQQMNGNQSLGDRCSGVRLRDNDRSPVTLYLQQKSWIQATGKQTTGQSPKQHSQEAEVSFWRNPKLALNQF